MQKPNLSLEPLAALATDPRMVVLVSLLIVAAVIDCRTYKIPNWLTVGGATFALIYSVVVPFSVDAGFLWALGGLGLGFIFMLPGYALGVMGAGDVKLMAMAGAFLGVSDTLYAVLATFVVGGIAALVYSTARGALGRMFVNIKNVTQGLMVSAVAGFKPDVRIEAAQSAGKMPYGISISIGTIGYVVVRQLGFV